MTNTTNPIVWFVHTFALANSGLDEVRNSPTFGPFTYRDACEFANTLQANMNCSSDLVKVWQDQ